MARSSAAVVQLGGLRAIGRYQFDRSVPVSRAEGECRRGRTGLENRCLSYGGPRFRILFPPAASHVRT